ncbi:hypothetical protein BFW38_13465 [Terasakiispira papahanaumokuakeensis]|uniref:Glycosyl transferase family 4 domain-containing protein n=1 Tax=Terasakiispira papahanaumokuakeensis TaxID=197479 RepID=A0A1E2VBN1_9GAMM|nr:hypothetical protein [Terasakiispira papahanaumokuakeensis]ODC04389.1 hypothetical protein BFW38_13465 [Terasakiispira papahanaumokuakeensis]
MAWGPQSTPDYRFGRSKNTQRYSAPPGVTLLGYASPEGAGDAIHHYLRDHEAQVRRGQQVVRAVQQLINQGITPDITVTHPAWGEALFLKTLLPKAHHIQYCEFYYQNQGADIDFDPEYPSSIDGHYRSLCRNATQLLSLTQTDACISPTQWQCSRYPIEYQHKIKVVHEGVNTLFLTHKHWPTKSLRCSIILLILLTWAKRHAKRLLNASTSKPLPYPSGLI